MTEAIQQQIKLYAQQFLSKKLDIDGEAQAQISAKLYVKVVELIVRGKCL